MKLNLGAGNDIRSDFINHDVADLLGIDIVHDLNSYPWPWQDDSFDNILAMDVLEHLDDPKKAMEALLSITNKNLILSVPREPLWRVLNVLRLTHLKNLGNTPGHLNHWSKRSFVDFISNNMDIVSIRSPLPWTLLLCKPKS